eukprot:9122101-Alexandrium_andersonii.AAC.1
MLHRAMCAEEPEELHKPLRRWMGPGVEVRAADLHATTAALGKAHNMSTHVEHGQGASEELKIRGVHQTTCHTDALSAVTDWR